MKHGKKYVESAKLVEANKLYEVEEAFSFFDLFTTGIYDCGTDDRGIAVSIYCTEDKRDL